jgi:hypothetical protein
MRLIDKEVSRPSITSLRIVIAPHRQPVGFLSGLQRHGLLWVGPFDV